MRVEEESEECRERNWWCEAGSTWHNLFSYLDQSLGKLEDAVRTPLHSKSLTGHADSSAAETRVCVSSKHGQEDSQGNILPKVDAKVSIHQYPAK